MGIQGIAASCAQDGTRLIIITRGLFYCCIVWMNSEWAYTMYKTGILLDYMGLDFEYIAVGVKLFDHCLGVYMCL